VDGQSTNKSRGGRQIVSRFANDTAVTETPAEYNAKLIDEFRANGGHVGGDFEGTPLLLIHHVGAKSGKSRINPVGYLRDGERFVVYASSGGSPKDPAWVGNLGAQPNTTIEVGGQTLDVVAEQASGEERERLWGLGVERYPQLAEYAQTAGRVVPVIVFTPR
jgi:deazaflavin-dependent oxidoreductase (nitroreductase family)